ncbi:MAG: triacylglycerol lipase [Firmicutes bacterium]|nr:triacylglycerol lipase [Bacillota bacterium]
MRRIWVCVLLAVFLNIVFLSDRLRLHPALGVVLAAILCAFFVWFNIRPVSAKLDFGQKRLRILMGGRECILCAAVCLLAEAALYLSLLFPSANRAVAGGASGWILATNGVLCLLLLMVLVLNGFIRIFATSAQAGISARVLFVFLWWLPGYNIYLLKKLCADAVKEYKFAAGRAKLNQSRAHEAVCGTKYPILLVHGIFFRDWNKFNYWGRIPKELEQNGAACFYGNQKSSASVAECGAELAECIRGVVKETGCEKVNVIAHSKGGLDSRWAISRLGADKLVASLTTVNTPHRGCGYVGRIIEKMPKKALASVGRKYETLFSFLGDDSADFLGGLSGLTEAACASLNREMPDAPGVYYQSVGSRMTSRSGAAFPLSLGYGIIAPAEGDNDGLVAVSSMEWGNFLGVLSPKGKQGISHADMIYTGC